MNNLSQNLQDFQWLKTIGVKFFLSTKTQAIPLSRKLKIQTTNKQKEQIIPDENLDTINSIEDLKDLINNFNGCSLKDFALNTVFSDGNKASKIMLIGEAPGAKEDELGIPFCGESGILLDEMLASIGLSRKQNVYITNTIFWRPPANRKPTKEEANICKPFMEKHISLINPELIICVGSTAVAALLGDKISINDAREKIHLYSNKYLTKPIQTSAIFHPAYLLRQPGKKKDTWFDLIKISEIMGLDLLTFPRLNSNK